ncbi:MAG: IGHMBP2 family helicase [Cyclobacteriaceae bacterium]
MANIREELLYTIKLLRAEHKEDLIQFQQLSYRKSIKEKKESGICWYPVTMGKVKWAFSDKLVIELEKPDDLQNDGFQSGKTVAFFSNAGENNIQTCHINGVINNVGRKKLTITLPVSKIPDWVNEGKLGIELTFDETGYRIMQETLTLVANAKWNRLADLRDKLLGLEKIIFHPISPPENPQLNRGQNEALGKVLSAVDLAIIHGPPGTGKTTTLIQAIVDSIKKYPQVMVCAPSNAAVDLLVEKLQMEGVDALRLGHPARVDDAIISQTLDAKIVAHPSYKNYKKLKKEAEECRRDSKKFKRNFGPSERSQRKSLATEAKKIEDDAEMLYRYMLNGLLSSSPVVACTLVGAASQLLKGKRFPIVFMDEAAQGLEPASWIPVLLAEKVVMAGDHCQLPPTIKSREAATNGLKETLFEKCIVRNPEAAKMLTLQYRMPEPIMAFPNIYFYNGQLKAASNTLDHFLEPDEPVLEFIDTAGSGFGEHQDKESMSLQNKEEAEAGLKILTNLLKKVGLKAHSGAYWEVGLIAPYQAQVKLLKRLIQEEPDWVILKKMGKFLTVSSVDGFQGQEKDIILISMTRSNSQGEIGFLADTRRMNVALTRAKRKLIIIGDSATLCTHPFYQQFLDHLQERGFYKSIYEYPVF